MKVAVLLGAGASAAAGIPTARSMLNDLSTRDDLVKDSADLAEFRRLTLFVRAGLEFAAAGRGESAVTIEIERLGNAVLALAGRSTYEAAPFVTSWNDFVVTAERNTGESHDAFTISQFQQAVSDPSNKAAVEQFLVALRKTVSPPAPGEAFRWLGGLLDEAVRRMATLPESAPHRVDYLAEIFSLADSQDGLVIGTLNYDRTLEVAAERASTALATGLRRGGGIDFPDDTIHLLKLHGSVDWAEVTTGGSVVGRSRRTEVRLLQEVEMALEGGYGGTYRSHRPAIVFGGANKLKPSGPYLELYGRWRDHLAKSDRLLVVGYSFRDEHINEAIRRANLKMVICDLNPEVVHTVPGPDLYDHFSNPILVAGKAEETIARAVSIVQDPDSF